MYIKLDRFYLLESNNNPKNELNHFTYWWTNYFAKSSIMYQITSKYIWANHALIHISHDTFEKSRYKFQFKINLCIFQLKTPWKVHPSLFFGILFIWWQSQKFLNSWKSKTIWRSISHVFCWKGQRKLLKMNEEKKFKYT